MKVDVLYVPSLYIWSRPYGAQIGCVLPVYRQDLPSSLMMATEVEDETSSARVRGQHSLCFFFISFYMLYATSENKDNVYITRDLTN